MKHMDLMKMGILVISVLSFTACKQVIRQARLINNKYSNNKK